MDLLLVKTCQIWRWQKSTTVAYFVPFKASTLRVVSSFLQACSWLTLISNRYSHPDFNWSGVRIFIPISDCLLEYFFTLPCPSDPKINFVNFSYLSISIFKLLSASQCLEIPVFIWLYIMIHTLYSLCNMHASSIIYPGEFQERSYIDGIYEL